MGQEKPREIRIIEDQWATFRHVVEAVAIVAAGAWAFYTFVYAEKIKPASEPAALSPNITVSRLGRDARREILGITISFHNAGRSEIDLAADAYNIWGVKYASKETTTVTGPANHRARLHALPIAANTIIEAFVELRDAAIGGRPGTHFVLEPGDTQTFDDVIAIERGKYDAIHSQVVAIPVKTSDSGRRSITISRSKNGGYWLNANDAGYFEDDTQSDFALIP